MGRRPEHSFYPGSGYCGRRCLHPHVHCLVSGGGISDDASTWHPARRKFLVPIKALAKLIRGKFRAMLRRKCPDLVMEPITNRGQSLA